MKKILLILLLIFPFCISACSCDNFDFNTYETAVKYYNNSVGIDYTLTKVKTVTNAEKEIHEEGSYKYTFTPNKKVIDFSSIIKSYEIEVKKGNPNSNPSNLIRFDRYYKNENSTFYERDVKNDIRKKYSNTSYEDMYDSNSEYNISNLVPTFTSESISNYKIVKHESKKGYSIATFEAACPSFAKCDEDLKIKYTITIDRDFYFNKIEFTTVYTIKAKVEATDTTEAEDAILETTKYTYEFNKFNENVVVEFPNDLANY